MLSRVGFAGGIQIHIARGFLGGALAEIDEGGAAVGQADQHESAAAQVARERMRDGEREADRDRGVHGVAAVLENLRHPRRSPGAPGRPPWRDARARVHGRPRMSTILPLKPRGPAATACNPILANWRKPHLRSPPTLRNGLQPIENSNQSHPKNRTLDGSGSYYTDEVYATARTRRKRSAMRTPSFPTLRAFGSAAAESADLFRGARASRTFTQSRTLLQWTRCLSF